MRPTTRFRTITTSLVALGGLTLTGCGSSVSAGASSGSGSGGKTLHLGMELFDTSDSFSQETAKGARAAAAQFGADLKIQAPNNVDPTSAQAQVKSLLTTGLDGMAIGPEPAPLWTNVLNQASAALKGNVVTFTSAPAGTGISYYVGSNTYKLGVDEATAAIKAGNVPTDTTGDVLIGICVPDSTPLQQTTKGMVNAVRAALPHAKIVGPTNVGIVPNENLAGWQQLVRAHPRTVLALGPCDVDAPDLAKVKTAVHGTFAVGTTDVADPSVLAAIKSGVISGDVAQNWYLQGYTAIRLLIEKIQGKKPAPGWYDTGTTVVTASNAAEIQKRNSSDAARAAWNAPLIASFWKGVDAKAKPLSGAQNPS